ncbi:hypothetical protein F5882DRAFT_499003 [Hyaloscypha sp. PMI_1271]|nr:hypothetical protein F5882DRAFT_499003 [Hyaloscypha sp. PMI_1271]
MHLLLLHSGQTYIPSRQLGSRNGRVATRKSGSDRVAAVLDTTTFDEEIATFTELKEVTEQAFAVRSGFILGSQFENMNVLRLNKLRVTSGTGPGVIARARFSRSHRQQSAHPAIEVPEITSSPHHHSVARSPIFQNDRGEYMVTFGSFAVKLIFVVNFSSSRKGQSKSETNSAMGMPLISTIVVEGRAKPNWCRSSHLFASQRPPSLLQLIQPLVVFISSP